MRHRFTLVALGLGATITAGCGVLLDFSHLDDGAGGSSTGASASTGAGGMGGAGGAASVTSSASSHSSGTSTTATVSATSAAGTGGAATSSATTGGGGLSTSSGASSSSTGGPTAKDLAIDIVAPGPPPLHFKIDATEVTVTKYAEFIDAFEAETPAKQMMNQHPVCTWNGSVRPNMATPNAAGPTAPSMECMGYDLATEVVARPQGPIRCIDWCDAAAYCIWAGGYMCRSDEGDATHPTEWKTACASPSGNKFPYGPTYQAAHCVDANILPKPTTVATYPLCQSSYGVYDMSGNVSEWLDCGCEFEGTDPTTTNAYLGGGAYHNVGDDLDCTPNNTSPIGGFRKDVGARCCYAP